MKKLITFLFVTIVALFLYIDNTHAFINNSDNSGGNSGTCTTGVVCRYSFCGMRDSSQAGQNGNLAQSCPQSTNQVFLDIVFRCSDPNKSVSDCSSFVSWAYHYKNTNGESCEEPQYGNYDYIFKHTDSYLKKSFKNRGEFYCPQITASISTSLSGDKYNYGYVKDGNADYDASNPDSAKAWKDMPTGRKIRGGVLTCIDDSTDLNQVRTETEQSCSGAVVDSVESSIENNKEILGLDEEEDDHSGVDCSKEENKDTIICSIYAWGMDLTGDTKYSGDASDPCDLITGDIQKLLHKIFFGISVAGIIILVVMTAISLAKVITASEDEALRNFFKGLWKRLICLIILLLLPMIVTFIIQLVNNVAPSLGIKSDNPLCNVTE